MAYELATSVHFKYDKSGKVPFLSGVERVINAGFKNLDFNFLDMVDTKTEFLSDGYKEWIYQCKDFVESKGAKWVQSHAVATGSREDFEAYKRNVKRSIECSGYLGIEWIVLHPLSDPYYYAHSNMKPFEFNMQLFHEYLETAEKYKVGLAIENNTTFPFYAGEKYEDATENLITLVDKLDSKYVGVCWDFGHANINCVFQGAEHLANQSEQLKMVGHRLKATHVHDNHAKMAGLNAGIKLNDTGINQTLAFDEHIQPYMGTIDWDDVVRGLDAIQYDRYFTFEAHRTVNSLPEDLVDDAIKHLRIVGESIVSKSVLK